MVCNFEGRMMFSDQLSQAEMYLKNNISTDAEAVN